MIHKVFKVFAKLIFGILAAGISLYCVLILINWQDEAPTTDALKLAAVFENDQNVAAEHNGYHYFATHSQQLTVVKNVDLDLLFAPCNNEDCQTELLALKPKFAALLTEQQAFLDFYQTLIAFSQWQEAMPAMQAEIPAYYPLSHAHRLFLTQIWLTVQQGDLPTAKAKLEQDFVFWRKVLNNNNHLLSSMISRAALQRHLGFIERLAASLTTEQKLVLKTDSWQTPFSPEELSLTRAFAGEWLYAKDYIEQSFHPATNETVLSFADKLLLTLAKPLLLKQATANQYATQILSCTEQVVPQTVRWYQWFYNPTGKIINAQGSLDCTRYTLDNLEPLRQQALFKLAKS